MVSQSTQSCMRLCKMTTGCPFWTFGDGYCWIWIGKFPDEIRDFPNWTSGVIKSESPHTMHVGKPRITKAMLRQWSATRIQEVRGMRYRLGKTNRGHCTNNGECHCFPPFRGPQCEYEERGLGIKKPYRAVLHYLTSDDPLDIRDIERSLPRLWNRYNKFHDYPVIIFHDGL